LRLLSIRYGPAKKVTVFLRLGADVATTARDIVVLLLVQQQDRRS
jgi:hypothetical protein